MPAINLRNLHQLVEHKGREATANHLIECLQNKTLRPEDFSVRDLAETLVEDGREWVHAMRPGKGGSYHLLEAGAVTTNYFSRTMGQLVYTKILEAYESEAFVFSALVDSWQSDVPTREKIPGVSRIGDEAEVVDEGQPYPYFGVSEDYIEIAEKKKRGGIVPVTKETILFDRTGLILKHAGQVGEFLGLNREKRVIDAIIDENAGAVSAAAGGHRYHWKGTSYATYQSSSPWDNVTGSNTLVDYTDIENALLTLRAITDPYTGEPINVMPTHLFVTPQLEYTARRILNATEIRSGDITTGTGVQTITANPINTPLTLVTSQLFATRLATDTTWFVCNPKKAWAYVYNWDLTPEQAAADHPDAFNRDIVTQFKASVRDCVATLDPRYSTTCTV